MAEKVEERSPVKRGPTAGNGGSVRSGSRPEKVERGPEDVTGINPKDMRPIDPRMPYIPPP